MRSLIAAVACFAAIFWSARTVWKSGPTNASIESLRRGSLDERRQAARQLEAVPIEDLEATLPVVTDALRDADPEVRVAAVRSLATLIFQAAKDPARRVKVAHTRAATLELVGALKDAQPAVRSTAAIALQQFMVVQTDDLEVAIQGLSNALTDVDREVRAAVARSLGTLVSQAAKDPLRRVKVEQTRAVTLELVGALHDAQPAVRAAAAAALRTIYARRKGAGAAPPVSSEEYVQADLDAAIAALSSAMKDGTVESRAEAASALAAVPRGPQQAPPQALVDALEDETLEVRLAAIAGFSHYSGDTDAAIPALMRGLERGDYQLRSACFQSLQWVKPSPTAVSALIEELGSRDHELRSQGALVLAQFGPPASAAIPALLTQLKEPVDIDRINPRTHIVTGDPHNQAVFALGRIAPGGPAAPEVLDALIQDLPTEYTWRRAEVVEALGKFGPQAKRALPLVRALQDDKDPAVRQAVQDTLSKLDPSSRADPTPTP
jgi:HEAT repeat protein